mgnify:CR=1 FL=1
MANEVPTVRRVYIKDPNLNTHSMIHTVYAGEGPIKPGEETVMKKLEFFGGVARDVPTQTYKLFKDLGHATTDRPKRREQDDD